MKNHKLALLMTGLAFSLGINAFASADFIPIQEKAQGQSLVGGTTLNDSLYSNPAGSAFTNVYSVGANMLLPRDFEVSVMDTKTGEVGGGIGYFRRYIHNDPSTYMQGAKLALLTRASNVVGVGIAGKMLWGPADASGNKMRLTDVDLGTIANFHFIQFGLVLRNVLGGNIALADEGREIALGARFNYQDTLFFSASVQSRWDLISKPYQYGFGAEYVSPFYFSLKGGYYFQPAASNSAWTMGVSLLTPRLSLHYAVEFPSQSDRRMEHQIGMTCLF